ncbi:MAG TPA: hypothetical protein VEU55_06155 [Gemmatimonadales bacterium]|nr:hypothetical protein [Gemmatimonadales bacterium]
MLALLGGGGHQPVAQTVLVSGRVMRGGAAARPLAGAWVVLHRIARDGDGRPIDSTRTDAQGRFSLTIARPDSAALYLASSWYAGIAYFSEPIAGVRSGRAALRPLYVYDTSSTGPPVHLAQRLVTIAQRKRDGARAVLELLELENPAARTRVAPDTLRPTWTGALPAAAIQFQVGRGDISPQAVTLRGDSVAVFGPIPPGERKQLSYAYVLPADLRAVTVPIDQATSEVDLLLEDTTAVVSALRLDSLGIEDIDGRRFARYRMRDVAAGARLAIALPERGFQPQTLVPLVVAVAALILGVAFVVALRRKPTPLAPPEVTP